MLTLATYGPHDRDAEVTIEPGWPNPSDWRVAHITLDMDGYGDIAVSPGSPLGQALIASALDGPGARECLIEFLADHRRDYEAEARRAAHELAQPMETP